MSVNSWSKAARKVLKSADKTAAYIADKLCVDRAAVTPYLTGTRKPSAQKALDMNKAIAEAVGDSAAAMAWLDCEAASLGFVPVEHLDIEALGNGAGDALQELAMGYLVSDWRERVVAAMESWDPDTSIAFVVALNREQSRLLFEGKRVPWKVGLEAVIAVLRDYNIASIIAKQQLGLDAIDRFRDSIHRELDDVLDPSISARERFAVEHRLFIAGLGLIPMPKGPLSKVEIAKIMAGETK